MPTQVPQISAIRTPPASPPTAPSRVLDGDKCGASGVLPHCLPIKNAPASTLHVTAKTNRTIQAPRAVGGRVKSGNGTEIKPGRDRRKIIKENSQPTYPTPRRVTPILVRGTG